MAEGRTSAPMQYTKTDKCPGGAKHGSVHVVQTMNQLTWQAYTAAGSAVPKTAAEVW